jgi:hypothetical protein
MVDHAQIIARLGGQSRLARLLGRDQSTVSRWATNGIPPHAYSAILTLARRRRVALTYEELAEANPRFGRGGDLRLVVHSERKISTDAAV